MILGFANFNRDKKIIYDDRHQTEVENINPYLVDASDILVTSRNNPICDVPPMIYGNKPADGGNLIIEAEDYDEFIQKEPNAKKFIRPLLGAAEYLNNKKRYYLWLVGANPSELKKMPLVMKRIEAVKEFRLNSKKAATREDADRPTEFQEVRKIKDNYILVPRVSSENRKYIPIGFMSPDIIASDAVQMIPNATLYHFGVLTSNVHMAWTRTVCGRLEMRYRYSKDIVYNNFVWCNPTDEQRKKIEQTAQAILDARALYPDSSLADLYDERSMPPELRKTHQANDKAVMNAYGFDVKSMTEAGCVDELMKLYKSFIF